MKQALMDNQSTHKHQHTCMNKCGKLVLTIGQRKMTKKGTKKPGFGYKGNKQEGGRTSSDLDHNQTKKWTKSQKEQSTRKTQQSQENKQKDDEQKKDTATQ